jgi:type I restriction enzyme S subunit
MKLTKIGEFLKRSKIPIDIHDEKEYNRVTIKINHNGVSLRDSEVGKKIGTKKQFILKSGQFIVSKIDARYGAFGIAPVEVNNAIITGNFWAYDVDIKLINIDWFNQFTNSPVFYEVCERASSGITHRKYLDEKFFLNYEILLPSVEEQLIQIEKINTQKVSFGELTSELTHQLTLVKKLRQQLLQDAVQGKLVEQNETDEPASELLKRIKAEKEKLIAEKKLKKEKELPPIKLEEIPFEIPENWVWCRLGEIAKYVTSGSRDWSKFYSNTGANFIRSGEIKTNTLAIDDAIKVNLPSKIEGKRSLVEKGDLLTTITGGNVGKCAYINEEIPESYVSQSVALTKLIDIRLGKFLHYCFQSPIGTGEDLKASVYGIGRPVLSLPQIQNLKVPLPPLSEQIRIVQKLDELMKWCDELETSIKESKVQNEKLLQQVLREALRKEL